MIIAFFNPELLLKIPNEGAGENGQFLVELSYKAPENGLNLSYILARSAEKTNDYQLLQENVGNIIIKPGEKSTVIGFNILDDNLDESKENITINLQNNKGYILDSTYKSATIDIEDDYTAGFDIINVSEFLNEKGEKEDVFGAKVNSLITSESGIIQSFVLRLTSQPTANVTLTFENIDNTETKFSLTSLTFTEDNWNQYQKVTVTGKDDAEKDGDITYKLKLTTTSDDPQYSGNPSNIIEITNRDNETNFLTTEELNSVTTDEERQKLITQESKKLETQTEITIKQELGKEIDLDFTKITDQNLPKANLSFTGELTENGQSLTLNVTLDKPSDQDLMIKYDVTGGKAVDNIDYKITGGTFALLRQIGEANPWTGFDVNNQES